MRKALFITILYFTAVSCAPRTSVIWVEGERQEDRHAVHELIVCNPPKGLDWDIWGVFDRTWTMPVTVLEGSDATIERYDGVCLRISPMVEKDTLHIRYDNRYLNKHSRAPRGFTLKGRHSRRSFALPLEYRFLPCEAEEPGSFHWTEPGLVDIIPSVKKASVSPDGRNNPGNAETVLEPGHPDGWYRIDCAGGNVRITASDKSGADYAGITLARIADNSPDGFLPDMSLEDWPDMPVRAFMLDVARNYLPVDKVCELIDILYHYKMNTLLLHLTEDEGWRIEIDGLPELTGFGAFHAVPEYTSEGKFELRHGLFPSQDGKVGKKKPWGSGSGYYSREDYKKILRYAAERHIAVIPELDVPGHSSAAIEAMDYRARAHGDGSYLLTDPGDTSSFMAYQGFVRNVVDVSLPSTYRFIGKVLDELVRLHAEAGVPLETVNISGDEVADGCWLGSPSCIELMRERGWSRTEDLWSYFLDRVIDMLAERGLKFAGYAEVVAGTSGAVMDKMRDNSAFIIVWRPLAEKMGLATACRLANDGFSVLMSNGDYTYMDNAYTWHKAEPGLTWAGTTDEFKAWSYDPLGCAAEYLEPGAEANIVGIEPMLWGDNIYNWDTACYLLFPKVFGLFDRCWNARPSGEDGAFDQFYSTVTGRDIPFLESKGITHRTPMTAIR